MMALLDVVAGCVSDYFFTVLFLALFGLFIVLVVVGGTTFIVAPLRTYWVTVCLGIMLVWIMVWAKLWKAFMLLAAIVLVVAALPAGIGHGWVNGRRFLLAGIGLVFLPLIIAVAKRNEPREKIIRAHEWFHVQKGEVGPTVMATVCLAMIFLDGPITLALLPIQFLSRAIHG